MMQKTECVFLMPDLGEGLTHGEILECRLNVGDCVEADYPALVIETTKASIEVPLPFGGEVTTIHVKVGEVIPVGKPLVTLLTDEVPHPGDFQFNHLVGQRINTHALPGVILTGLARRLPPKAKQTRIAAAPATRRLAREMDVDLDGITGTGKGGAITIHDVRAAFEGAGGGS